MDSFYLGDGGGTFLINGGPHRTYNAHIRKDGILYSQRCENLKSYMISDMFHSLAIFK
jgi:hypothetical protein